MPIVNTKSAGITSFDAPQRLISGGNLTGASITISKAVIAAGATDFIGSTYRFGFVPSGVSIQDVQMQNDATITGAWQLGVYLNSQQGLNVATCTNGWSSLVAYVPGSVVNYQGVVYVCTAGNTGSQPPSGNWTTGGGTMVAPSLVPVPNAHVIFGTGIATSFVTTTWKSVYTPTILAAPYTAGNVLLRVWELLGFSSDPEYLFHLTMTCTTAPIQVGNVALSWSWVK
jgi:hypothetical protein